MFALGHSNGAFLANLVAAKLSRRIAAIASVAGTIGGNVDGKTQTIPAPAEPVSVLLIHGKLDPVVSYDGSGRAMLTGVSAPRSAKWWAERDGCRGMKETKLPNGAGTRLTYTGGAGGTEVELISTDRGTHDFPAALQRGNVRERESGVAGMEEIVRFFARHPKGR